MPEQGFLFNCVDVIIEAVCLTCIGVGCCVELLCSHYIQPSSPQLGRVVTLVEDQEVSIIILEVSVLFLLFDVVNITTMLYYIIRIGKHTFSNIPQYLSEQLVKTLRDNYFHMLTTCDLI